MLVRIIAIGSQKRTPSERQLRGGSLCLLALSVVVKPLAHAIGNHLCCDGYDNVGQNFSHAAHLPSVARMEKGSEFSITYPTGYCNFRQGQWPCYQFVDGSVCREFLPGSAYRGFHRELVQPRGNHRCTGLTTSLWIGQCVGNSSSDMESGTRVAAPCICFVPWAALASCRPRPQQLLPVSATGGGRRRCPKQSSEKSPTRWLDKRRASR